MSLNHLELSAVAAELQAVLPGQLLGKLNAPEPGLLQLIFRRHVLLADLNRGLSRIHLIEEKLPAPPSPPAWVMKARGEIQGRILDRIESVPDERIVRLTFGGHPERILLMELFGRGRLLLLDAKERIIANLIGDGPPGQVYAPPPGSAPPEVQSRFGPADPDQLSVNVRVAQHHARQAAERALRTRRQQLGQALAKRERKLNRRLSAMEQDLKATMKAEELARGAEALKVQLGAVRRGQRRVELADPWDPEGGTVAIELDPALDAVANMKRMFSRARRLTAARGGISQRIEEARQARDRLRHLAAQVAMADSLEALAALDPAIEKLQGPAARRGPRQRSSGKRGRRQPYRRYHSRTGQQILVGRSGPDNHALTFRVARGQDLWLHTRDAAGAHVIVRLGRGAQADEQTLIDAATLAAHHSPMKDAAKVEVTYTRVKHVHPIKGAPPGLVSVARARTLLVRMEPQRIERLKLSRED